VKAEIISGGSQLATKTPAKVNITPLADRVVVRPAEAETQRASGLYVADTAKEKPQRGTVLAVGPGRWEQGQTEPMNVAAGDEVLFAKYAGTEIRLDDEDVLILSQKDILAKLNS
jgi:chaperonin GroES